jgi:hypothetical protein
MPGTVGARAARSGARRAALPGRWPLRRWLTQASVAATVLVMLVAGSVAYRALGDDNGESSDGAGGTKPTEAPSVRSGSAGDPGGTTAILDGQRRTLLHVREVNKDLSLAADGTATVSGGGRSAFTLIRSGDLYLIRSHEPIRDARPCLEVRRTPRVDRLVAGGCTESDATLFHLGVTGRTDELGRPTYYLKNTRYGTVQWSSDRSEVFVEPTEPDQIDTSFVLVDQGPA